MNTPSRIYVVDGMRTAFRLVDGVIMFVNAQNVVVHMWHKWKTKLDHTTKFFIFPLHDLDYDNWMHQTFIVQQDDHAIWMIPRLSVVAIIQNHLLVMLNSFGAAIIEVSKEIQADSGSQIAINSCDDHGLMVNMVLISWGLQCICAAWSITMMHWQNILKSVIFAQSHPLRSHVHDKTLRKGQMGIKVWIGNAYWRIGGTGSLIGNGLLNTYKKVVVKSIWLYWQEGLMIIYVPRLDMEWRFVRKKSKELKVIDGSLIDYYEFNFYKRQSQMKLSQRGIGIYKEVKLDCTFGIKTTMWVFEESTMKLNNAIQMQNHKSQRRWRIKCYGDTQSNVKVKLLKRFQCLITGLDIIGQVFKNQCPIRQSQICHSQQRIDYAMSMSQSQHYYWVLLNPNLSWKITIEYFTKYIQMAKYTHLKLELYWSWACLNAIWARSYLCPRIRLARLVQLFINAEDATKIMGNEQFKRRDYKSDLNTFRLLKFDPKLIVGPSLKFDLPFVNQVFSDLPKTANKFVFILVIPSFEARYGRMPPDIARSLHDSPSTAATWEDISSLL